MNRAIDYFDKMFEHHKEYSRICDTKEYCYSAPLVSKVTVPRERHPFTPVPENFWESTMSELPENLCKELRKIEKDTKLAKIQKKFFFLAFSLLIIYSVMAALHIFFDGNPVIDFLFGATPGVLLGLSFLFTMISFNKLETKE